MTQGESVSKYQREKLPWLVPSELNDDQRDLYNKLVDGARSQSMFGSTLAYPDGRLRGPFNALLMNPSIGNAVQQVGVAIRYESTLSDRTRELAILMTACDGNSEYEWAAHAPIASKLGFTSEQLDAVHSGIQAPDLDKEETLASQVVSSILATGDIDSDLLSESEQMLGIVAVVELIFLIGYYRLLSLSLKIWQVPLPVELTDAAVIQGDTKESKSSTHLTDI